MEGYKLQLFLQFHITNWDVHYIQGNVNSEGKIRKIAKEQTTLKGREQLEEPILDKGILISQRKTLNDSIYGKVPPSSNY